MTGILADIIAYKRAFVAEKKREIPLAEMKKRAADAARPKDFVGALVGDGVSMIAEIKNASPSKGMIRADMNPLEIARIYEENGAAGISVLTDEKYFQGNLERLSDIRKTVDLPLLRKDFTIDPYQIYEARCAGADAVLLIAACLGDGELKGLMECASSLGMASLVEVHDEQEMDRVSRLNPKLIGINNRDLATFKTDLATTEKLAPRAPSDAVLVSESGINVAGDVERVHRAGVHAMLVGEALMRATDIGARVRELVQAGARNQAGVRRTE